MSIKTNVYLTTIATYFSTDYNAQENQLMRDKSKLLKTIKV